MSTAPAGSPAASPYSTSPPSPPTPATSPIPPPSTSPTPPPTTPATSSPTGNPTASPPSPTSVSPPSSSTAPATSPTFDQDTTWTSPSPPSSPNISTGALVGIIFGALFVLVVWSMCSVWCWKKWKKNRDRKSFSRKQPQEPQLQRSQVDPYGGSPQQWQHNAHSPSDHVVSKPLLLSQIPSGLQSPLAPPSLSYASSYVAQPSSLSHASIPSAPLSFVSSSSGGSGSKHSGGESSSLRKSTFTYEELVRATDGFSDVNLLGQGGFGFVHKGILPNDKEVAVKQLKAGSGQGEREFQAEVEIISRVHHRHLVSLVGYCSTGFQRLLAYEFVPNNTLEFHLHGNAPAIIDWSARHLIALGSAKGLAYLHEDCHPKIIHRDIKAANILIDFKFEAKVADFGLAKIASDLNTHVSTRVMGTFGYLAPEYAASGKLTDKSDVFSYGVVLLELLTGRQPIDKDHTYMNGSLVEWARPLLIRAIEEDNVDSVIDPRLLNEFDPNQIPMTLNQKKIQMTRMVACAAACTRHSAMHRPKMSQVVRVLEGDVSLADLNAGVIPGHSSVYNTQQHQEDMIQLRKTAFRTQENAGSSDYGSCSDYGSFRENIKGNGNENSQRFSGSS